MSERAIFVAALHQSDPAERQAFLDRVCASDVGLRDRVEALLAAYDGLGSFLDAPAAPQATGAFEPAAESPPAAVVEEQAGGMVGRYKLLEVIGEGGMGVVWMAEQAQPIRRRVALKVVKAGMDSKQVLARFEAERQALALMDHPHIAHVFDAGSTPSGRPYVVMELVRGVPITQYCDDRQLGVAERLRVFQQVCSAVQHAHQKGIIHRDLKPSNVLVESHDGVAVPKVIDFGLAKAFGAAALTERSLFTNFGAVLGTPLYMAPEQAEFGALDVDTRADVYALGVLLYELLTGTTPIEKGRLAKAAWDEIRRVIKEEEPPSPSARLSSSEGRASVAALRQTEPAKLAAFVRSDLDWVVMKALAKERDRRYESASAFAQDVERFLNHEPVAAGPPTASYKLRRFVRRHRPRVIAASLVLLALVCGMAGTTFGLIRAEQRRVEAVAEKRKAEQAEEKTLASYRASTDDAIEQLIGSKPDLGPQERTYLTNTLERWREFAKREGNDERSQAIRAEGHFRVANLWSNLGQRDEARREYEAARDLQQKLAAVLPAVPAYQRDLARTRNNLGNLLANLGQDDAAQKEFEAARDLRKKLAAAFPADPMSQQELANTLHNLGLLLYNQGQRDAARKEYEAARDLQQKLTAAFPAVAAYQRDLARTHNKLGNLLANQGQRNAARKEYEATRDLQKKLAADYPGVPAYQQDLATTYNNLGNLLSDLGQDDAARKEYEAARDVQKKLAATFPAVPIYQQDLGRTHHNLGLLLHKLGQGDEARREVEAARDLRKKLATAFPGVPGYQVELGSSYSTLGGLLCEEGKPADSLVWFDLAAGILKPVLEKEPRDVSARRSLRRCHMNRAFAYEQLKRYAEAVKEWDQALELSAPAERPRLRANRAASRLLAGHVAEAVAEVAELTKSAKWNAAEWYDFACVYAVASGKIADQKQEYADRAMQFLHQAVKAGYKDAAHMKKDTDLDPLREREDFKKLLAELDAKGAKP